MNKKQNKNHPCHHGPPRRPSAAPRSPHSPVQRPPPPPAWRRAAASLPSRTKSAAPWGTWACSVSLAPPSIPGVRSLAPPSTHLPVLAAAEAGP